MKRREIAYILGIWVGLAVGCMTAGDPPIRSVVLPVGTKIIAEDPAQIRTALGVDTNNTGKVVLLTRPLLLSE